ncbi:MAG: hypothetical protein LBS20_10980 [Prevotella sp.]|jgi:hypothetical protein|nr:hypothetical protein [Prevotella sp.]
METNDNNLDELKVPESITDPDEREYFEYLCSAVKIAAKKGLPFMFLTAYNSIGNAFLSTAGCKKCMATLIKELLDKHPDMFGVIMGGVTMHLIEKSPNVKQITDHAKKNTPAGN